MIGFYKQQIYGIQKMFETFQEQSVEAHQRWAAHIATIVQLLTEKGIITSEEFSRTYSRMVSELDQIVAKKREDQEKEFEEKYPGISWFFKGLMEKEE